MGSVQRFEDLDVWKDARQLASEIHKLTQRAGLSSDWALRNQLNRAAGSISR